MIRYNEEKKANEICLVEVFKSIDGEGYCRGEKHQGVRFQEKRSALLRMFRQGNEWQTVENIYCRSKTISLLLHKGID